MLNRGTWLNETGKMLPQLFSLLMNMLIILLFIQLMSEYSEKWLSRIYNNIKPANLHTGEALMF